MKTLPPLCNGN